MVALPLLPVLAAVALLALLTSAALLITGQASPPLAAHVAFALGVMPLILGAMSYFIPVLTRSDAPGFAALGPPLLATGGGAVAVLAFATGHSVASLNLAAALGALGSLILGAWALRRAGRMVGSRHRGLDWYLAALGLLLLALLAVALMPVFPAQRPGLRLFHLHANLLGFVGLTALGTLQVLVPTCLAQADPTAMVRLRQDLKWAVGGTLLIACGAALRATQGLAAAGLLLSVLGALLYGGVVLRMLQAWWSRFGRRLLDVHGAAASLAAATFGLLGLVVLGAMHGAGWLPARPAVAGFVIAFLLPLVSGAAAQLLPVWLRPGIQGDWHRNLRARLCRWSGVRGPTLVLLGLLATVVA